MTSLLFPYELSPERIAQRPAPAGKSRLLHAQITKSSTPLETRIRDLAFVNILDVLRVDDLLVLNNSKVIPARFFPSDLGEKAEMLLLSPLEQDSRRVCWEVLARPLKKFERSTRIELSRNLCAYPRSRSERGDSLLVDIEVVDSDKTVLTLIEEQGVMPIPPYIRNGHADEQDRLRYQTIYADVQGSVAAPTAGLHFTEELLYSFKKAGRKVAYLTHHVGPASFLPVRDADWQSHQMSVEHYQMPKQSFELIQEARDEGRRVVAVGTTTVRALESFYLESDLVKRQALIDTPLSTELFITPGFEFRAVDVLITNFHQPLSTHLLLVAAFSGVEPCEKIYNHGLSNDYRFLSYGDSMCIEHVN